MADFTTTPMSASPPKNGGGSSEKFRLAPKGRVLETDVIIAGGGATGAGLARDLSLRGFKCALF